MLQIARLFFILGVVFIVVAGVLYLAARVGIPLGRLPGDLRVERGNMSCIFALGTSLLLSVALTILLNVIVRLLNR